MSTAALRHSLFVYGGDDELGTRMVPFLTSGLDAGELVAIVAQPPHRALFQDAFGDGSQDVAYFDPLEHYTRPQAALAGYDAELRRIAANGARSIRMFAEMPFDFRDEALPRNRWMAYEAIFNRAFAHHPLWLACSYDAQTTPEPIVDELLRTHPEIFDDGRPCPSEHYADPSDVVRDLTPEPVPLPDLPELEPGDNPARMRRMLATAMANGGVADGAARDLLVAAGEIFANARRHGGGLRRIRAGPCQRALRLRADRQRARPRRPAGRLLAAPGQRLQRRAVGRAPALERPRAHHRTGRAHGSVVGLDGWSRASSSKIRVMTTGWRGSMRAALTDRSSGQPSRMRVPAAAAS